MTAAELRVLPAAEPPAWLGAGPDDADHPAAESSPGLSVGRSWRSWDARRERPGPVHRRHDRPDGSKSITWTPMHGHRLEDLVYFGTADGTPPAAGSVVVMTEGEKAADALTAVGILAAGTVCGASSTPGPAVVALLARYRLTLSPDNDDVGRGHMSRLAEALERAGAEPVRWIDPPEDAPAGWDLADATPTDRRELVTGARELLGWGPRDLSVDPPGWRTLADISDDPPGPLLFGIAEPAGETLLYAGPGVGKGTTGAHLVCEALTAGMRPMIFDAERRPREWARRVSGFGGDRSRVAYLEPDDLGPRLAGRPFWDQGDALRALVSARGIDLLILDSLLPAAGVGEDQLRSDAQAPFLFVRALASLGTTSIAFGHPPKGQPEGDPFGSMAWLAAFRLTWLGTKAEGDGHRVRWRPRKRNERGHIPGVLLSIAYGDDGRPCGVTREDDEESTRDWILAGLIHGPRTVAELADELLGEYDEPPTGELERAKERVGRALRRMAHDGFVERIGGAGGRNVRWALRVREMPS